MTRLYRQRTPLAWLTIVVCIVGYVLPWLLAQSTALSSAPYDLAEWARQISYEPVIGVLLLRLPLVLITLIIAFQWRTLVISTVSRWILTIILVGLVLAQLPPLNEFRNFFIDPNYLQKLVLSGLSAIGSSIVLLYATSSRRQAIGSIIIGLLGIATVVLSIGEIQAYYTQYSIEHRLEIGVGVILIGLVGVVALGIIQYTKQGNS